MFKVLVDNNSIKKHIVSYRIIKLDLSRYLHRYLSSLFIFRKCEFLFSVLRLKFLSITILIKHNVSYRITELDLSNYLHRYLSSLFIFRKCEFLFSV